MDYISNPFSPGAGTPPPALVGRDSVLEQSKVLLQRVKIGKPEKSLILTGLRGVGKTVLLNHIEDFALESGYRTMLIEAHAGKSLASLIVPELRNILYSIDRMSKAGDKARKALRILKSFIGSVSVKVHDISVGIDIDAEVGVADSGDLETDFPLLIIAVAEAAKEKNIAVAVLIDEVQYLSNEELSALIMAIHKVQQKSLPLIFVGAGLPIIAGLAGNSKTYAERLFSFPNIGALDKNEVKKALKEPVQAEGVDYTEEAIQEIYNQTQGYPYFVQEWGYQTWNQAATSPINDATVIESSLLVRSRLDKNFFKVRFDRLSVKEKLYLRSMAELGGGPYKAGDIASKLNLSVTSASPVRANLINKGMIYSPAYGEVDYTVPLFGEFMIRSMKECDLK